MLEMNGKKFKNIRTRLFMLLPVIIKINVAQRAMQISYLQSSYGNIIPRLRFCYAQYTDSLRVYMTSYSKII